MRSFAIASVLGIVLAAGAAHAGMLATGAAQADTFICSAVNVGSGTIGSVTIEIVNSSTGTVLQTNTCSDLPASRECAARLDTMTTRAYCRITPAKKVRGNLLTILGTTVLMQDAR